MTNGPEAVRVQDRRRRPDRRQRRKQSYQGPERRRGFDRRQPRLLNPRTGRPESLESSTGRTLDIRV